MKKILLVNPGYLVPGTYGAMEPFGLAYLASFMLQHGYEVKISDEIAGDDFEKDLELFKPDLVGVTSTTQLSKRAYQILDHARKRRFPTVMGGPHASALPEDAARHADLVVVGEGEAALLEIARGTAKGPIVRSDKPQDLDRLPFPARDLLRMDFYLDLRDRFPDHVFNFAPPGAVTSSVMVSRGCPYRCIFCYNPWRNVRSRSVANVMEELLLLKNKYGVTAITLADEEIFFNKERALELFRRMVEEKLNFTWSCSARANLITPELLAAAKQAGCVKVSIGFESGSQRILDILQKRTTVEQNRAAVKMCRDAGIKIGGYFMIGNPTETLEDIELTRRFIRESAIDYVGLFICTPLPGTELFEKYVDKAKAGSILWENLNYSDCEIPVNNVLSKRTIETQYELLMEEIQGKGRVPLSDTLLRHLAHPVYTVKKIFSSPRKILRLLDRVFRR